MADDAAEASSLETREDRAARVARAVATRRGVQRGLRDRARDLRWWSRVFLAVLAVVLGAGGVFFYYAGNLAKQELEAQVEARVAPFRQILNAEKHHLDDSEQQLGDLKQRIASLVPTFARVVYQSQVNRSDYPLRATKLRSAYFIDAGHGWVVGDNGPILSTTDGFVTWQSQEVGSQMFRSVQFFSRMKGWVLSTGGVALSTADGGATWQTHRLVTFGAGLGSLQFLNPTQGWAVGENGTILSTADGGSTWQGGEGHSTSDLYSIQFVSPRQGWAVGDSGTILSTADGGVSWQKQDSHTSNRLTSVDFVSSSKGWVIGSNGTILSTTDGGATWQKRDSGTTHNLHGVFFISPTYGWVVGSSGTILSTADGGATWQKRDSGTISALECVQFVSPTQGWIVGDNGTILQLQPFSTASIIAAQDYTGISAAARDLKIADDPVINPLLQLYGNTFHEVIHLQASISGLESNLNAKGSKSILASLPQAPSTSKHAIVELFDNANFSALLIRIGISGFAFFFVGFVITVYRYHMRVAAHHDACADALELCEDPLGSDFRLLVRSLSPASIDFGKEPRSFIDRVFDTAEGIAGRAKDAKE